MRFREKKRGERQSRVRLARRKIFCSAPAPLKLFDGESLEQ
jgi:hypothetical protein